MDNKTRESLNRITEALGTIAEFMPKLIPVVVIDADSVDIDDLRNVKPGSIVRCYPDRTKPMKELFADLSAIAEAVTEAATPHETPKPGNAAAVKTLRDFIMAYSTPTSHAEQKALRALEELS